MDDSISVGEVLPVLCPDLTTPYHAAQLLLEMAWVLTKSIGTVLLCNGIMQKKVFNSGQG